MPIKNSTTYRIGFKIKGEKCSCAPLETFKQTEQENRKIKSSTKGN